MNLIMATLLICVLSNATLVKSKLSHCSETFNISSVCRLTNDYNPSLSPENPSKVHIYFNIWKLQIWTGPKTQLQSSLIYGQFGMKRESHSMMKNYGIKLTEMLTHGRNGFLSITK